jgi:hypothetical protein
VPINPLRSIVQKVIKGREPTKTYRYGTLGVKGSTSGNINVTGRPGYVYVTLSDGSVVEARNVLAPSLQGFPVIVGYDPQEPNKNVLQVLGMRQIPRPDENTDMATFVAQHHASHEWLSPNGGQDAVFISKRQMVPLRPIVVPPFGVYVDRDVQKINGQWAQVGGTLVDLTSLRNTCMYSSGSNGDSLIALITLDLTSGSIVTTAGSIVDYTLLNWANIPAIPANNLPICAVKLYAIQAQIIEAGTYTDLIDLRYALSGVAGAAGTLTGSGVSGQLAAWDASTDLTGYTDATITHETANNNRPRIYLGTPYVIPPMSYNLIGSALQIEEQNNLNAILRMITFGGGTPVNSFWQAEGTSASPSATLNNDYLGYLSFTGYGSSGWTPPAAYFAAINNGSSYTDASQSANFLWSIRTTGSAGFNHSMTYNGDLIIDGSYYGDGSHLTGISASDTDAKIMSWMRL